MGIIAPYFQNLIFGWMRGTNMPNAPANIYIALFNGDPLGGGTASEQTAQIRTAGRLPIGFGAPSGGVITNAAAIDFGKSANNVSLTHGVLMDAQVNGNALMSQALTNPRTIYTGDPVYYEKDQLQFGIVAAT